MNDDPQDLEAAPLPQDPEASPREQLEAETFMQDFDHALAGNSAPARAGSTVAFAADAARSASAGLNERTLDQARARVRQAIQKQAGSAPSPAPAQAELRRGEGRRAESIPLTSIFFARLLARLGLGVLDVVVLLIVLLIGTEVLVTLFRKSDVKSGEPALAKKDPPEKKIDTAGEGKDEPEKHTDNPNWAESVGPENTAADIDRFVAQAAKGQSTANVLAAALDSNRDMIVRAAVVRYLYSNLQLVSESDRKAIGSGMVAILADEQNPTLLKKFAVRGLREAALTTAAVKDEALQGLATLAEKTSDNAPLRAEVLDALIRLDPARTDKVLALAAENGDSILQTRVYSALSQQLSNSPETAARLSESTAQALLKVLQMPESKENAALKGHAATALAHAIRQGNAPARAVGLPALDVALRESKEDATVKSLCEAAQICADPGLTAGLKKTYYDFLEKDNMDHGSPVRLAAIRALRALLMRQSQSKKALSQADLAAAKDVVDLLVTVIDNDASVSCKNEAATSLRYLYNPAYKPLQRDAIEALLFVARDTHQSPFLRQSAVESLEVITALDFGDIQKWVAWFEKTYPKPEK